MGNEGAFTPAVFGAVEWKSEAIWIKPGEVWFDCAVMKTTDVLTASAVRLYNIIMMTNTVHLRD